MVSLTIDKKTLSVPEGITILEAARSAGIRIPTLCALKNLNEIGACRVCVVEVEGSAALRAACNTIVSDGMVIHTNTRKVREARRDIVELILSRHDCHCPTCPRNGNCELQTLAADLHIGALPFASKVPENRWNNAFPLIRQESKCIGCLRCVAVCDKVQGLHVWDLLGSGSRARVGLRAADSIELSDCVLCGQCITHCPVGALTERDDTRAAWDAIEDEEKITVAQIAPAVRAAWAEQLGIPDEIATVGRMVAAAKALGFSYVLDTDFSADLTIMEEASELLERLAHKEDYAWPMFTSCCPGWVRFARAQHPELLPNLSSAKSPQQMFGAMIKTYFAEKTETPAASICSVSIMPCVAKKYEAGVPAVNGADAGADVDLVLTTREFARMIREAQINVADLPELPFDAPLGLGTGAGVIFGTTGGVMEAALRTASFMLTGKNPDPDAFRQIRIESGYRTFSMELAGSTVTVAVVSGLENTDTLLAAMRRGEIACDFVEVMACPGGCAGGGGQPIIAGEERAALRGGKLRALDCASALRFSHENPDVQKAYAEYLEKPLSEKAHHLLHTNQAEW
ncbi:MAG: 2Fe-2S iron-sulfur cluster binding domain-containing protein [Ruminococcaceae bacterium]|nr:2Fe-2S iron-sulfur cluster binding domain-containing protein [Oscillospiraceae bacterium]